MARTSGVRLPLATTRAAHETQKFICFHIIISLPWNDKVLTTKITNIELLYKIILI